MKDRRINVSPFYYNLPYILFSRKMSSSKFQIRLTNYFTTFFNFTYALCLTPFRLRLCHASGQKPPSFIILNWWPQKLLCIILTILNCIWVLRETYSNILRNFKTPEAIFQAFLKPISCFTKFVVTMQFWTKQGEFIKLLNYIVSKDAEILVKNSRLSSKLGYTVILAAYLGIAITDTITIRTLGTNGFSSKVSKSGWNWWWWSIKRQGYFTLLFRDLPSKNISDTVNGKSHTFLGDEDFNSLPSDILGVVAAIGLFYRRTFGAFCDALMLTATITLWAAACGFGSSLKDSLREQEITSQDDHLIHNAVNGQSKGLSQIKVQGPLKWTIVLKRYESLKRLAVMINSLLGTNFTLFIVNSILDYAITFEKIFAQGNHSDWGEFLGLTFYFLNSCFILVLSAEACQQLNVLKEWLSKRENRWEVEMDELHMITNEIDTHAISIKCSNIFPITYSLAADMAGITVTYFIICIQQ